MKTKSFVYVLVLMLLAATPILAQTWDLYSGVTHGETAVNPNGPWSYGSKSSATANDFALSSGTFSYAGLFCWTRTYQQFIGKNTEVGWAGDGTFYVPQGWLIMVSNSSVPPGEQTIRWTSPMNGSVFITATFAGGNLSGVTSNGHIVKNGSALYSANIVGYAGDTVNPASGSNPSATIGGVVPVVIGDNIDFVVDTGFDGSGNDHTRLFGSITNVLDMPGTLEGTITLPGYNGSLSVSPIELVFTPVSGGTAQSPLVILDANPGTYSVEATPGTYNVTFTAGKALSEVVTGVVITTDNATVRNVSLVNGDADGSNEITSTDLSIVLRNLGQSGNW